MPFDRAVLAAMPRGTSWLGISSISKLFGLSTMGEAEESLFFETEEEDKRVEELVLALFRPPVTRLEPRLPICSSPSSTYFTFDTVRRLC